MTTAPEFAMTTAEPPDCPPASIVLIVEAWARLHPHKKPPLFRWPDVEPLLHGNDREFAVASVLLEADRVHYREGERP